MTLASLAVRAAYLVRLFPGFQIVYHSARAIAPTLAGALAVLAIRALAGAERTTGLALAELGGYLAVVAAVTLLIERAFLGEIVDYLRRRPEPAPGAVV